MKYIAGIDVGTTGVKCIVIGQDGSLSASHTENYPCYNPKPGWSEQTPEDWWIATQKAMSSAVSKSGADPKDIIALGFSGQMHGLVALDEKDNVIRPAILWNDQRTEAECNEVIAAAGGLEGLLSMTNNTMLTGYTGGKILWVKKNEPDNFKKMSSFLMPKDYIRFRITGEKATDTSEASGTGLFDVGARKWSDKLIGILGLDKSVFPKVYESDEVAGYVGKNSGIGLAEGTPVYAGGGDAVIQTTGMGIVKEGTIGLIIGTSGIVSMALDRFGKNIGGLLQYFCNNDKNKWQAFGCQLSSGGSMEWFRDTLFPGESFKALDEAAAGRPAGSNNLLFLPYLTGERCPYADPHAKGAFFGLTRMNAKGDFVRSVMEGVTYGLKDIYELILQSNPAMNPKEIISSGGGSRSALWRQIQADIFGLPVKTLKGSAEGGAYGAAVVAGVGAGIWKNIEEAAECLQVETVTQPIESNSKAYEGLYKVYRDLYKNLKSSMKDLG